MTTREAILELLVSGKDINDIVYGDIAAKCGVHSVVAAHGLKELCETKQLIKIGDSVYLRVGTRQRPKATRDGLLRMIASHDKPVKIVTRKAAEALEVSHTAVLKALRKLIRDGKIMKLGRSLYATPEVAYALLEGVQSFLAPETPEVEKTNSRFTFN